MTREEFIKRKIKEKGVTLKDYARMINMPYSTLLSMLAGNLGGASLDNVVRICNGLDTNIGVLQSPNMDPSAENGMSNLSEREKKLVRQYRKAQHAGRCGQAAGNLKRQRFPNQRQYAKNTTILTA